MSDRVSWSTNVDTEFADAFDEFFGCGEYGSRSRSEVLEEAAAMYMGLHEELADTGFEDRPEGAKRTFVRFAARQYYDSD